MKFAIVMMTLLVSANVFAYSITDSTVLTVVAPTASSASTSSGYRDGYYIIEDAQDFMLSGRESALLGYKIRIAQEADSSLSVNEAVDQIVREAKAFMAAEEAALEAAE